MFYVLISLAALAMLYVVVTLVIGGSQMARTGKVAREQSNNWMWKRVGAQAFAIAMLYFAFKIRNGG
ncbi:MAG: HIG1 domain-containing protein [Litorimonas sp.]